MPHGQLNKLFTQVAPGAPIAPEDLHILGISSDLAVHYGRAGWLTRLARGVYCLPNCVLGLEPSLRFLRRKLEGLHIGGKSALEWHGVKHHRTQLPVLHLYGWNASRLPYWFTQRFPASACACSSVANAHCPGRRNSIRGSCPLEADGHGSRARVRGFFC